MQQRVMASSRRTASLLTMAPSRATASLLTMLLLMGGAAGRLLAPNSRLQHSAALTPDGDVVISWTPEEDSNSITIQVEARTRGWAAIGFSPSGGMKGADIVLGWVADGKAHIQDMHAVGNSQPREDARSDVELLGGSENDTHTVFTFRRPLRACDTEYDLSIGMDTSRVIWAVHELDPAPREGPSYHGTRRGVRSVSLDGSGQFRYPPPGASLSFRLGLDHQPIRAQETFYHCSMHRIPDFQRKVHYTGYRVRLDPVSAAYVHHFVLYACVVPDHLQEEYDEHARIHPGSQCFTPNMPPSWSLCNNVLIAWAVGGEGDMLPEHVGLPLGHQHGGSTYFMLETHYNNPDLHTGQQDSSGLELFYTSELRPMEAAVLTVGHDVTSMQLIPPGQQRFVSTGICQGGCLEKYLPSDGVAIHSVLLHSHLAGRSLVVRHLRGGRELPPLAHDTSYDFNYQQSRTPPHEPRLMPGDTLLLECGYGTADRGNITMGGFGTRQEMCLAFLTYYPSTALSKCSSKPHAGEYLEALGVRAAQLAGQELAPMDAGEMWAWAGTKKSVERLNKLASANQTKIAEASGDKESAETAASRDDWFNRAQLSAINVTAGGEAAMVTLYDYLTQQLQWDQQMTDRLQARSNGGSHFASCVPAHVSKSANYRDVLSGPHGYPEFTPRQPEVAVCTSGTSGAAAQRVLFGAALAAPLLTLGRLLL